MQKDTAKEQRLLFFKGPDQPQYQNQENIEAEAEADQAKESAMTSEHPVDELQHRANIAVRNLQGRMKSAHEKTAGDSSSRRPEVSSSDVARMTQVTHMRQRGVPTDAEKREGPGSHWRTEVGSVELVIRPNDPADLEKIQAKCKQAGLILETSENLENDEMEQSALVLKDATPQNQAKVSRVLTDMALEKMGYPPIKEDMRREDDLSPEERRMIDSGLEPIESRIQQIRDSLSGFPESTKLQTMLQDLAPTYSHPSNGIGIAMPREDFLEMTAMATQAEQKLFPHFNVTYTQEAKAIALTKDPEKFFQIIEKIVKRLKQ